MQLTWQTLLQDEFLRRKGANARYSMRAFARSMGVSPSYACMVLKGQRSIALATVAPLSRKLQWAKPKERLFRLLIERDAAKDAESKAEIEAQVKALIAKDQAFGKLETKDFPAMSAWYHTALSELVRVKGFDPKPAWIAKRLGISSMEAELALDRLTRLGILEQQAGTYRRRAGPLEVGGVPSAAIRRFHRDMLKRADQAVEDQALPERSVTGVTLAVPADKVAEVKSRIAEFRREMATLLSADTQPGECDAVYHLAIQYFRVDAPSSAP